MNSIIYHELRSGWILVDKFDDDLMCREGFLSHDLLQARTGQSILIVWHHYEISIYILIAYN